MKRQIFLSIAFSVFAANVFAADGADHLKQFHVAEGGSQQVNQNRLASDGSDHLKNARVAEVDVQHLTLDLKNSNVVAEVRSEFGSQYQRY